jgi:ribosome biogenesis SPOUT family RNA methylase Rps3
MIKEKHINGYKVTISYTPTTENPDEIIAIAKALEACEVKVTCKKLILDSALKSWLEDILLPVQSRIETIEFKEYITINIAPSDTITLPYNKHLPFNIPVIEDRVYALEDTNLFEENEED